MSSIRRIENLVVVLIGMWYLIHAIDANAGIEDWAILLQAIADRESTNEPTKFNKKEEAYGLYQIRRWALEEANEYMGTNYTLEDCYDRRIAKVTFQAYVLRWGAKSYEEAARIWNGGPTGNKENGTIDYWADIKRRMFKIIKLNSKV